MTSFATQTLEIDQSPATVNRIEGFLNSLCGETRTAAEKLLLKAGRVETRVNGRVVPDSGRTPSWSLSGGQLVRVVTASDKASLARMHGENAAEAAWSYATRFIDALARTG